MEKAVIISGAGGFVANSLLPHLVSEGLSSLILIDPKPINPKLLSKLRKAGATVLPYTTDHLPSELLEYDIGGIVCLAGATSVDAALADPAVAIRQNIEIAVDLAEWARLYRRPVRIVYMSSDEVLGASLTPLSEEAVLHPTQPYASSKAAAEILLHNYRDVFGLDLITMRSCNLIGPRQREPKLIPVAVRCILSGIPVPVHGTGEQLREWMAVEDLCTAITALLNPEIEAGLYQACSGVHYSVNEIVEIIQHALAVEASVVYVPDRLVQDHCYAMCNSRLRTIGWSPRYNVEESVIRSSRSIADSIQPFACA